MIISKGNAPHYVWGGDCDGWRLADTAGLSVIHERMPAGRAETRHHHAQARQLFYVLAGELTMERDSATDVARAGEAIEIAPGERHRAVNASAADVEFLVISAPTTRGDRVEG
ncbi:MAG TPA: cupin domain-containing protein [Hyphomicrobiaceae bacterium]|nr:cupin domain-containing protein [Hyphomicrobiaceae bacterium]